MRKYTVIITIIWVFVYIVIYRQVYIVIYSYISNQLMLDKNKFLGADDKCDMLLSRDSYMATNWQLWGKYKKWNEVVVM